MDKLQYQSCHTRSYERSEFQEKISGLRGADYIYAKLDRMTGIAGIKLSKAFQSIGQLRTPSPCTRSWLMGMELLEPWV